MIKNILIAISKRISEEVKGIKYVDRDWNQLNYEQPPVKWPCALIDCQDVEFTTMSNTLQRAKAVIAIRVSNLRSLSSSVRALRSEESFKTIDIMEQIHSVLHLWQGYVEGQPLFTPLIRQSIVSEQVNSGIETYTMTYTTTFDDINS